MSNYEMGEVEERFPFDQLVGVDEVGVGPIAGPVIGAAVMLDMLLSTTGIKDSKKLSEAQRARMSLYIRENALCYGIGEVSSQELDERGVAWATSQVKVRAVRDFLDKHDGSLVPMLVVDGTIRIPGFREMLQATFPKGDNRSWNIAAASIVAKEHRDKIMREAHKEHPDYGFDKHKGYPTKEHKQRLREFGPCSIHRKIMRPVKELLDEGKSKNRTARKRLASDRPCT